MNKKLYAVPLLSSAFYSVWGASITLALKLGTNAASLGLLVYFMASVLSLLFSLKKLFPPKKEWIFAGLIFASANFILFNMISSSYLSAAYIFLPSSILMFYLFTLEEIRQKKSEKLRISLAVTAICLGMMVSQVSGPFLINWLNLGLGLLASFLYGVSSFLSASSTIVKREMAETFWIVLLEITVFLPMSLITGLRISLSSTGFAATAALCVSAGLYLELFSYNRIKVKGGKFRLLNMINVLTNFDIVFVAIASVFLGSFTVFSLIGLALTFVGIIFFF
jgi:hypothetical protein